VVEPLTPVADALQLLATRLAVNGSCPDVLTFWTAAELVTEPAGPIDPCVLTSSCPELNTVAGPYTALPDNADAVAGLFEAFGASVTAGAGPRAVAAPPNKLTFVK